MAVQVPTPSQLRAVAERGRAFADRCRCRLVHRADAAEHRRLQGYRGRDAGQPAGGAAIRARRDSGPPGWENAHNAWYVKTTVAGAADGLLKGKAVVLKDNIMLAGVPMMNGTATLEGYMPDIDATVVQRILDCRRHHRRQGALRGAVPVRRQPHPDATGPGHNPHRMGYSAGGSSSGSAVLVVLGRGRHGAGRRPGRLDPHARVVLRRLRDEADARAGALYRNHADRDLYRSHRPDHPQRRRQRTAAGGDRRGGRLRSRQYSVAQPAGLFQACSRAA